MSEMTQPMPSLGKVLVVGGCGFLGSHIVSLIVKRHPESQISVLDLRTNLNRNDSPKVSYHDGDITDIGAIRSAFERLKPDVVINTASPHFNAPPQIHDKVNVQGTKNLVKVAQGSGVKAFVHTSSASVLMGPGVELVNADERWPMITGDAQPEYYTTTKAYAETAVLEANRTPASFLSCAIRPAGIFGEGDVQLLPPMIAAYHNRQTRFQIGENENLFDFTYVENVAYGHLLAVQALLHTHSIAPTVPLDNERVDGETFLITNGQPVYFWDFARAVWHEAGDRLPLSKVWKLNQDVAFTIGAILEWVMWTMGRKPKLTRQQARYSTLNKYHNIEKARSRLGYRPLIDLDEGVRRGVRHIMEQEEKASQKKGQ